jgi:hypothetical protein
MFLMKIKKFQKPVLSIGRNKGILLMLLILNMQTETIQLSIIGSVLVVFFLLLPEFRKIWPCS